MNIGNHNLIVATTKQEYLTTRTEAYSLNANIGTDTLENPGFSIEARLEKEYASDGSTSDEKTTVAMNPGNFTVRNRKESSSTGLTDVWVEASINGLKVATMDGSINITPTAVKGLADPDEGRDAANKKYVDESIAKIPEVDTSNLVPYTGATKDIELGDHAINFNTTGSVGSLTGSAIINVGKFAGGTGSTPGVYMKPMHKMQILLLVTT